MADEQNVNETDEPTDADAAPQADATSEAEAAPEAEAAVAEATEAEGATEDADEPGDTPAASESDSDSDTAESVATDVDTDAGASDEPTGDAPEDAASEGEVDTTEVDLEALRAKVSQPAGDARYQSTGKRKTSVARVILTPGEGFLLNGRSLETYFPRQVHQTAVTEPLTTVGALGAYQVWARLHGGGQTGQAGALRHGIAKALAEIDPGVRTQLKSRGFLKVDTRQVERKKAGLKKARKRPQFSKR